MHLALVRVAEQLATEFGDVPCATVVRVVTACVDEFPYDEAHFIEQAARARLTATAVSPPPVTPRTPA